MAKKAVIKAEQVSENDGLKQDLSEIKLLLATMLRDIDKMSRNIQAVTDIQKIKAGMYDSN